MSVRALALLFSPVLLAACAQSAGEVCEVNGDCESGLVCCLGSSSRGVCDRAERCNEITHDGGVIDVDAQGVDAQVEPSDAAAGDASGPGLGQPCSLDAAAGLPCARGLACFRGVCLLDENADAGSTATDAGGGAVDSGSGATDAGSDAGAADDDAGLDGGP